MIDKEMKMILRDKNNMTLNTRHIISHIGTATNKLRRTLTLMFVISVLGTGTLESQETGLYYIVNNNTNAFNPSDPTNNWYLVPASNGGDTNIGIRTWTWNDNANTPLLTTYQTQKDINSIWVVEKVEIENNVYYHLIHVLTNKYITLNSGVGQNSNRRTFHMETPSSLGDNHLFTFTEHPGTPIFYSINPKAKTSGHKYLNPSNGNKPTYYASATTDGGYDVGGTLGLYNKNANDDAGSKWFLESNALLPAPSIDYDSENNTFSISYDRIPSGNDITFLYTTNGDTPEIGGSTTSTFTTPVSVSGTCTVKAVVVRYGLVLTQVASKFVGTPPAPTITLPNDCENMVEMTSADGCPIYYTLDSSAPNQNSILYSGPFALNEDVTIKAVAYNGTISSATTTLDYTPPYSVKPTITQNGNTITISGTGTIYYTTDGSNPTTESTPYNDPIILDDDGSGGTMTIKAIAKNGTKEVSCIVEKAITLGYFINNIQKLEDITSHLNDKCIVTNDFDASGLNYSISGFTGEFDGGYYTLSGLTKPLFTNPIGATIKNVICSDVNIRTGSNVGAICDQASGATRIYNCGVLSGSINGTGNVGGLVGLITGSSEVRVVNCFNYANVSGGNYAAGIVGKNEGTVGDVRIALCMMYGNVTGATNISPVYGGNHVSNVSNFTEYNYWLYSTTGADGKKILKNLSYTAYNDQLAIEKEEYLTRFPFYRHILNSHRELASYFLFGDYSNEHVNEIGHWAINNSLTNNPYPIVEKWETNTKKILVAPQKPTVNVRKGDGNPITSLSVSVKIGSNTYTKSLPITDMDIDNHDYTWGKVILPFANEFETNTDYTKICTGWKITDITGGTTGSSFDNYDVSDRDCTSKDLYYTTGFIFAQGGNYIVPYNVTAIEITANFATAFYLSDQYYEIGYSGDKSGNGVSGYTGRTGLGGETPNLFHGQTVYHTLASALAQMTESGSTHEQAVVLVGNYHQDDENLLSYSAKGLTIMSIDADNNQEPDYAWYSNNTQDRPAIPPTRFDFIALIPVGMSSRVNNSTFYPGIPIWKARGWFELTETSLSRMDQFELDSNNFNTSETDTRNYRCIINGGYFTQMVRSRAAACSKVKYYQIGGKAYIKEFYPGSHSANNHATPLVPINVTGGEIEQCFMTGYGKGTATGSNIYFWCAGGKIDKFLGAYMENPSTEGVNMTAKIDHARIGRFFGGGTSPKAKITGNINVTINNSHVDFYCGGPEFGDMSNGKTVTTHATNTTFNEYYGAGFGGTAITYTNDEDNNTQGLGSANNPTVTYPSSFFTSHYGSERLKNTNNGIGSCYKFEFIFNSRGAGSVARFYTGYAQFSLATTGSITNVLNGCTITGDFYGAGCQGKVNGTVESLLTNCTLNGSAYGGGYKAEANQVNVYPATTPSMSVYTRQTGIFSDFGTVEPIVFEWKQNEQGHAAGTSVDNGTSGILYTGITMTDLGNVTDNISITIDGGTVANNVFGGGNESKSLNNTTVTLKGDVSVGGDVFGGGNKAIVSGSTQVNIE